MLDQNDTPDPDNASGGAPREEPSSGAGSSGGPAPKGGMLGRWRAGMTAQGDPYTFEKPLWRVMLVGFVKWTSIAVGSFLILSLLAVFTIGWTGPAPTFNMAGVAMKGVEVRSTWVDLKDISPHLVRAVIASEEQNFCTHDGFDLK